MSEGHKSVKVSCSFCGNEMECPQDMLEKSEKHMCFECFQNVNEKEMPKDISKVHIDIPKDKFVDAVPQALAESLVEEAFPEIWKERKEELKEMSKKELAKEMFGMGAYIAANNFIDAMKKEEEEMNKNAKRLR